MLITEMFVVQVRAKML